MIGCEVYATDLESHALSPVDILKLTDNDGGLEITSNMAIKPYENYYQDIAASLSMLDSGYIFVPYGTGHLYGSFVFNEIFSEPSSINIIGGKTNSKNSKADKLYAPFNPFSSVNENFVKTKIAMNKIGKYSSIVDFKETSLNEAINMAKRHSFDLESSALGGLAAMIDIFEELIIGKNDNIIVIVTGKSRIYDATLEGNANR